MADPTALASLIRAHDMTWEMVPSEQLDKPEVWEALAEHMPLTALIRNLATLTRVGVYRPDEILVGLRAAERHWQPPSLRTSPASIPSMFFRPF